MMFPVGQYTKQEVRKLAKEFNLPNADRKESMGICFVGNVRLAQFLAQRVPAKVGAIVGPDGTVLGQHAGVHSYTLGQRDGLNIGGTGPYYVVGKNLDTNTLVVSKDTRDAAIMSAKVTVENVNWITGPKKFPFTCEARFRHQQELQGASVEEDASRAGALRVAFKEQQRAPAPGQSLVLYKRTPKGVVCLGGGTIV